MKFDVQQRYEAPAHDVMALYCDVGTYESLPEFGKISRPVVLDRNELGSSVTLRLRYRFTAELPAAALAVIDPERLTWIDETVYDFDAMTATTRLLPDHYASKLTASATASYLPTAGGDSAIRRVTGDVPGGASDRVGPHRAPRRGGRRRRRPPRPLIAAADRRH